jgi:hypothetical protein
VHSVWACVLRTGVSLNVHMLMCVYWERERKRICYFIIELLSKKISSWLFRMLVTVSNRKTFQFLLDNKLENRFLWYSLEKKQMQKYLLLNVIILLSLCSVITLGIWLLQTFAISNTVLKKKQTLDGCCIF